MRLYAVFHLNLAYSSIEEDQRAEVIRRCYRPLLRLAREFGLPLGIEATGYTLETIAAIDPDWVDELRRLTADGPCEFIGSGYAQIIGPLVPAEVNAANLRLGNRTYEQLLGFRPAIALVNEQAYASGLVRHYLDAGYHAIVMEWDNPARYNPGWNPEWRYLPQYACGQQGEEIPLIWNKSIVFQKFQRYAHGEMELEEYLDYLGKHVADVPRAMPLYGNDVEIFDFRPGRYHTEAALQDGSEWERIGRLFNALLSDGRFRFIPPGQVLSLMNTQGAGHRLSLESPEQPIPVKKQGKYNITRWAVTGKDDLGINTACWRIYAALKSSRDPGEAEWRELCYLWSSDFRTHITEKRWMAYRERLAQFGRQLGPRATAPVPRSGPREGDELRAAANSHSSNAKVRNEGRFITAETDLVKIRVNCRRGLSIDALWFKREADIPLCGTLHHGYYDDINWSADYYTGHLTLDSPGKPKVTDLDPVTPTLQNDKDGLVICGSVSTPFGDIKKAITISNETAQVGIRYALDWKTIPLGSLRLGHVTLNPEAFDRSTLFYRTHNGGYGKETFLLSDKNVDHGSAVSFLVSAAYGIGVTDGIVEIGDATRYLSVSLDKTESSLIGFVIYRKVGNTFFYRLSFSAGEVDETRRVDSRGGSGFQCAITIQSN